MKNSSIPKGYQIIGVPITSLGVVGNKASKLSLPSPVHKNKNLVNGVRGNDVSALKTVNRLWISKLVNSKITQTVKGKLKLGARILQGRKGVENIFKRQFGVKDEEKLLKASHCHLSTTAGPIAGLLFISTHKVSFCSESSITVQSSNGEFIRSHYKVSIPTTKIKIVNEGKNMEKPSERYIEIVTEDDFEFWFMGFLNYKKSFRYLRQACVQSGSAI